MHAGATTTTTAMMDLLGSLLTSAASDLVGCLGRNLFRRPERRERSALGDAIRPRPINAWVCLLAGASIVGAAVLLLTSGRSGPEALLVLWLGLALMGFSAAALSRRHVVRWDSQGVAGPSQFLVFGLGLSRSRIDWREVATTGSNFAGYWFVESTDRRRIYWHRGNKGAGALLSAIEHHCPATNFKDW